MAQIIPFQRYVFGPSERAALESALADFSFPGGWHGWQGDISAEGESAELELINPNDWEPLTLLRSRDGGYVARDADRLVCARARTFAGLLEALDIQPS